MTTINLSTGAAVTINHRGAPRTNDTWFDVTVEIDAPALGTTNVDGVSSLVAAVSVDVRGNAIGDGIDSWVGRPIRNAIDAAGLSADDERAIYDALEAVASAAVHGVSS